MSAFLKSWVDTSRTVHSGLVLETNDNFSVIDCACCRFKHVVPLPTLAELSDIYSNEYYTTEKPLYIKRYLEDKAWLDLIYEDRYSAIEECFGGRRGKILDIGSGPGLFWHMDVTEAGKQLALSHQSQHPTTAEQHSGLI